MEKRFSRWILVLLIVAFLCSLIPLFIAAKYNAPAEDDFYYGMSAHFAWDETHSISQVLKAAWQTMIQTFYSWQGSFTAIFLFALQPAIFGESFYTLVPWFMIFPLIGGIYVFTITLYHQVFGGDKVQAAIIATILCVLCTQFLPRSAQAFYWYNGSVYYNFFFALSLFAYSGLLKIIFGPTQKALNFRLIAVTVLLFLIGGGNLITGLLTAVLMAFAEVTLLIRKHPRRFAFLVPFTGFMIGFTLNFIAPGNANRQKLFPKPGLFRAVYLAFRETAFSLNKWFCLPVIILFIFMLPFLRSMAAKSKFSFPMPWLVTPVSICLTAVMYYPAMYAMGHCYQVWRIINIVYFGTMVLTAFNLYYWEGWLLREHPEWNVTEKITSSRKASFIAITAVFALFLYGTFTCPAYDVTAVSATKSYFNGQLGNYGHTYRQRLAILHDPSIEDAVLKRYPVRPYVLWYREYDQSEKGDPLVAAWYGKKSVITR